MKTISSKSILLMMVFSLAFGFSLDANAVSTDYTPTVKVKKIKDTYVTLTVTSTNLKSKDVKIKVKMENIDTDKDDTKVFEKKLSKNGKVDIKIDGLTKDNEYSFEVAIKKSSDVDYSDYSSSVSVNEVGDFDYNPTLTIKDETSSDVILSVTSTKLNKNKVKIKIRLENEDTDKVETRVFTKTLSKNGEAEITIDNLSKNTAYKFKALIKKSKDNGFSKYSNEKVATTEK